MLRSIFSSSVVRLALKDPSKARSLLRLTGKHAARVLSKLCAIDLGDSTTPNGSALRSAVADLVTDLIGFGKSDKPTDRASYTYANHVHWMKSFIETLDLTGMTLVGQDWGSLIGFRLVAENPDRFARVVAANAGLPDARDIPDEMAPRLNARRTASYCATTTPTGTRCTARTPRMS